MNTATAVGSEGFAQDDGRERRMRNKAFHTAVALSMLDDATTPARHPERSRRIYSTLAICMPTVSFAFHAIRPAEMHESDPISLAFIPLLLMDPSTSLRMTGGEKRIRNKECFLLGI